MTREELIALMERVAGEVTELEGKREKAEKQEEKDVLTGMIAEKQAEFDAAKGKLDALKKKEAREKEIAEAKKEAAEIVSKKGQLGDPPPEGDDDVKLKADRESRHNALVHQKKLDDEALAYITSPQQFGLDVASKWSSEMQAALRPTNPNAEKDGVAGVKAPSYMSRYILGRLGGKRLSDLQDMLGKGSNDVLTSDASGSQSGGGSLVPDTFVPELFRYPQIVTRLIDRCMVKRAVTGQAQFPRLTQSTNRFGVVAAWGTEGSALTEDNPVFSRTSVSTYKLGLVTQISKRELRQNRVGLQAELAWMFRGAMDEQITKAILQGSGSSRPTGVNTSTGITAGVNTVARETTSQVSYNDLVRLQFAVEDAIFEDGIFVFKSGSTGALAYISALDDSSGRPVLRNHNIGWREGVGAVRTIAGSEFIATPDNAAALGYRGDVIYGAFGNYGVAVDLDVLIERSDHFAFTSGLATFLVTAYIGGYPIGPNAFAVLTDASGASSSSSSSS